MTDKKKKKRSYFNTLGNLVVQPYFPAAKTHHGAGFKMNSKEMHFFIGFH